MATNTIPSQEETRTHIALQWLIDNRNRLDANAADYMNSTYNANRHKKLTAAIDILLGEYGERCGRCLYYDADEDLLSCKFLLPKAFTLSAVPKRMESTDGAGCPCWTKRN